ncbi:rhomboid family intramembrane serine protease [Bacillus pseudomycoides]|uniref:rhomboid family intramembrane serine protease n=1 Tax=Bacillus pseudomycoides TaxID=64104 RepID=UPI000BECF157|nr:rhomboid family intramembrane serine protease [Bacillus pseudomycoides]PEE40028.1 rhomboid family intramembrane serine protease [Bacillus pseudomycoides]PGA91391.1 rhomboid family intramembrane serine protease [Bacillus pseudomycoides]PHF37312.1 rhomboid family intramembrane serine protease [Bacillus pseudomycoides]
MPIPYMRTTLQPVILSLLFLQLIMMIIGDLFFPTLAAYNECISKGEWWRFITSLFIHVDFQHFLSNSICLFLLGQSIEKQLGSIRFPILFFTAGISGNIFSYIIMPIGYVHAGASGGIFGLLGAQLFLLYSRYRSSQPKELIFFSSIILLLLLFTFFNPSANPISHLTGLLIGGICTPFLAKNDGVELI